MVPSPWSSSDQSNDFSISSDESSSDASDDSALDELDLSSSINESMRVSILRQRNRAAQNTRAGTQRVTNNGHRSLNLRRTRSTGRFRRLGRLYERDFPVFCSGLATALLCFSFFTWIAAMIYEDFDSLFGPSARIPQPAGGEPGLFQKANQILGGSRVRRPQRRKRNSEALPRNCVQPDWQSFNFPSCNLIHEIDLKIAIEEQRYPPKGSKRPVGVLDNGLWRDVIAVYPSEVSSNPMVLKMMKAEHEVDVRNFDRHRRDALVMERLTASPHVVDIFGFCGNNVLTEFIGTNLEHIIVGKDQAMKINRQTPRSRLQLALDSAMGVDAIHSIPGGPIIHADLQAKQFLVTPEGNVKINDFNRCRFMAHNNITKEACSLRIPSAPGKFRSPEEYEGTGLNERLDIYSLGHVFFGIITGEVQPWRRYGKDQTKSFVMKGVQPRFPKAASEGSMTDRELVNLTQRAYTLNPRQRISATDLVQRISDLISVSQIHDP